MRPALLIVGNSGEEHLGSHLRHAAAELGIQAEFADAGNASGGAMVRRLNWRFRGHRPGLLGRFSADLVEMCSRIRPETILTTGIAPVAAEALEKIGSLGIRRVNLLTDDPFNPAHRSPWFFRALRHYDEVLSTRKANITELREIGCREIGYLPFGYAPHLHFDPLISDARGQELESDVVFAGGADADRIPSIAALDRAGLTVALYGGYWERYPETRRLGRGIKSPAFVRDAVAAAKIALCLVRRANRDGTCMRTFELAAIGAAMLVEKTDEHLELFGPEGRSVLYFDGIPEMVEKARALLADQPERTRLKKAAHRLIIEGGHAYRDRLAAILNHAAVEVA
jgi:spore maturation protein CgeB